VLEPPKNKPGPNVILQYRFDAQTGRLSPNTPHRVEQRDLIGPRHYIHHPSLDVVYFSNEQGCSVTAYRIDGANGTLSSMETTSTLPTGHSERTTCSQIHLTPRRGCSMSVTARLTAAVSRPSLSIPRLGI
jgi:6-phosphogluconolactonase